MKQPLCLAAGRKTKKMHLRKTRCDTVTKVILASRVKSGLSNVQLPRTTGAFSLTVFFLVSFNTSRSNWRRNVVHYLRHSLQYL